MKSWAGFDVGGQSVKAVLIDDGGAVIAEGRHATGLDTDAAALGAAIAKVLGEFARDHDVAETVGVGLAGVMGTDGVLHGSPNLPKLVGERVHERLQEVLSRPAVVDNDANCAAYGEGLSGAASGCQDYLFVTLGSGVGSGLVIGGRVYHGVTGYACELGHTLVARGGRVCGCGNQGCLEAYASESAARGLVGEAGGALEEEVEQLRTTAGYGYAQSLFELADAHNEEAARVTAGMIEALGAGLASAVNLLDVPILIIGGGIAPAVMKRLPELERSMDASLFARDVSAVRLLPAALGSDAGAVGAAALAMSAR